MSWLALKWPVNKLLACNLVFGHPCPQRPCGQHHGSRPLAGTEAGSPQITDFRLLHAASEIWNNNGYHRLQKWAAIALAHYPDPCQRSWSVALAKRIAALGTRMVFGVKSHPGESCSSPHPFMLLIQPESSSSQMVNGCHVYHDCFACCIPI